MPKPRNVLEIPLFDVNADPATTRVYVLNPQNGNTNNLATWTNTVPFTIFVNQIEGYNIKDGTNNIYIYLTSGIVVQTNAFADIETFEDVLYSIQISIQP